MKKYLTYLPHIIIAVFVLPSAFGKIFGAEMAVSMFQDLNLLGMGQAARYIIGIGQVLLVAGLFSRKWVKLSATLLIVNMIGAFLLIGFAVPALIVLLAAAYLLFVVSKCSNGTCGCCSKDSKTSGDEKKACAWCIKGTCDGRCGNKDMDKGHDENDGHDHSV